MRSESLQKVIAETAKQLNMPVSQVKEAIYHKYGEFRNAIKYMEYPEILDQYFCRYKIIPDRLLESSNYKELYDTTVTYQNRRKQNKKT